MPDLNVAVPFVDPNHAQNWEAITVGGQIKRILFGSASLDFPSIAANLADELTITVNGAKVGDVVMVGPPSTLDAEIGITGLVTAANVVTVRAENNSIGAVDIADSVFNVLVFGF